MQEECQTQNKKEKKGNSCCLYVFGIFGVLSFCFCVFVVLGLGLLDVVVSDATTSITNTLSTAPVVVVPLEGTIIDSRPMVKLLNSIAENSSYKAVVIRIDSPGGSVGSSEEIYRALLRLRKKGKVVVASMGNAAASGGYYIACGADKIITNAGTVTGSIGVIADGVVITQLLEKLGIEEQVTASGKLKQVGTPMRHATPLEKSLLKNVISDLYTQFFSVVLESRGEAILHSLSNNGKEIEDVLKLADVSSTGSLDMARDLDLNLLAKKTSATVEAAQLLSKVADGRILTGRQAYVLGLVDGVGGLNDAISIAGLMAKVGSDPRYVERKQTNRLEEWITSESNRVIDKLFSTQQDSIPQFIAPFRK